MQHNYSGVNKYIIAKNKNRNISLGFGATQDNLSQTTIAQMHVVFPPLTEQQKIVEYLDNKCNKIDAIISNIDKQIEKYNLLKRSLINEVITGQRAV